MRRITILAGLVLALSTIGSAGSLHSAQAQANSPRPVIEAYKAAFVKGDFDTALANFADNVAVSDPFTCVCTTKAGFLAGLQTAVRQNPGLGLSFGDTVYVQDTGIHRLAVASDPIRALGLSRIWVTETILVFQGKVTSYGVAFDLSDAETAKFVMATANP